MARLFGGINLGGLNRALNTFIIKSEDSGDESEFDPDRELQALTKEEDEVYAALGRRAFAEGGEARYPDIQEQLNQIEAKRAGIREMVAQIEAEKRREAEREARDAEQVRCPNCDAACDVGARFCAECGARLQPETPKCVSCQAELAPGARFCVECGAKQ